MTPSGSRWWLRSMSRPETRRSPCGARGSPIPSSPEVESSCCHNRRPQREQRARARSGELHGDPTPNGVVETREVRGIVRVQALHARAASLRRRPRDVDPRGPRGSPRRAQPRSAHAPPRCSAGATARSAARTPPRDSNRLTAPDSLRPDQPVSGGHGRPVVEQGRVSDHHRTSITIADDDIELALRRAAEQLGDDLDVTDRCRHDAAYDDRRRRSPRTNSNSSSPPIASGTTRFATDAPAASIRSTGSASGMSRRRIVGPSPDVGAIRR